MITLALLNVFLVGSALAVVKLTPDRSLAVRPPTVAARTVVTREPPALATTSSAAPLPSAASLAQRLAGPMRSSGLGSNLTGTVIDASTRRTLFASHADMPAVPASTTKITTSVAVLSTAGPAHRLTTRVVKAGNRVVIIGAGDPTLAVAPAPNAYPKPASLTDLARQVAATLKLDGVRRTRVDYDISAFQGSRLGPGWKPNYVTDGDVAGVSALAVNEGRVGGTAQRYTDPPRTAAETFAGLLVKRGISAHAGVRTTAPAGATQVGAVQSPPISTLVEQLLTNSDNDVAEAMARQVAISLHRPPSFEGGAQAVHEALARLGAATGVATVDGSGLSPRNQITPAALAHLLAVAASPAHPELHTVLSGMPIAGFSGTLAARYGAGTAAAGRGVVRAKTGTLNGVNTLAGVVYDADGRLLAFAFMANRVQSPYAALAALDSLAGTLAGCGCR